MSVQAQIVKRLKGQILAGDLQPGQRLPSRRTLVCRFDVSPVTIQRAIDQLVAEGFIAVGARKKGTLVAEYPPHLHHYKLLFPFEPDTRGEFWRALQTEAMRLDAETAREFSFYYGLANHGDINNYEELLTDVEAERVAGLIFASAATEFVGTPVFDRPGVPRAAIAAVYQLPGIPKAQVDLSSFFAKAVDHLLADGRRRIGVVFGASDMDDESEIAAVCADCLSSHGLTMNPLWTHFVHLWSPLAARHCVHLMLHDGQAARPDGLILADDNFLTAATRGVTDAGIAVPEDLTVVSIANFPAATEAVVPVTRIGFDTGAMLRHLVHAIDGIRNGEDVDDFVAFPALTKTEYKDHDKNP